MRAAVVSDFSRPPRAEDFPDPVATDEDEMVVEVIAAGLHPRVRSQADGSHYTSTDQLPLVPGVDGVGRDADGHLRYFIQEDVALGSMAERTVIDRRRSVVLPEDTDPFAVAAAMNPAMSSWLALRKRTMLEPGQSVLVLGATGSAGRMAVQISRHLGAGRVIAAARNAELLTALPGVAEEDRVVLGGTTEELAGRLGSAAADVDVVLDYLWGAPTEAAITAVVTGRREPGKPLTWIEIGSVAGPTATIPSAALRAARLSVVGSGQGSVPTRQIVEQLPEIARAISSGAFDVSVRRVPLADVEQAWADRGTAERIVITPQG